MLKKRIITAIILIIVTLTAIFILPPFYFLIASTLFIGLATWEWCHLANIKAWYERALYFLWMGLCLLGCGWPLNPHILWIGAGWWLGAFILMWQFPKWSQYWGGGSLPRALMGVLTLVPCWLALNILKASGHELFFVLLLLLVWAADIGAFFVGRRFGKTLLAPKLSPKKSWQGVWGGLVLAVLIGGAFSYFVLQINQFKTLSTLILIALITVVISVLGDLFESMLKRQQGVKDSGTLLPGHGGLLDRIDSLLAATPFFVLALMLGHYV